ncbi:E3 ubiquitin-protein ligase RNF113A-like isoform X2 [Zophobas morio]|uniref:E3 ubiquitin-protein ligase RNF113A-like isoform X2 n=1 Tax=Zophobas morio TaxID=2755281 RepID=UPI00308331A8
MREELQADKKTCVFFKKRSRKQMKKSKSSDSSEGEEEKSYVSKKEKKKALGISAGIIKDLRTNNEEFQQTFTIKSERTAVPAGPQDQGATSSLTIDPTKEEIQRKNEKKIVSSAIKPGPMAGSTNIRATIRWDYAPDVCKDYKETGYCGFGDTCKFMHDRGDYKMGWQLDKEYDRGTYGKQTVEEPSSEEAEEAELPFACFICRKPFIDPVVTRCSHYFCAKCALEHYQKSRKCYVCHAATSGIFNTAKNIAKKQERQVEIARNL